ncbi:unnamed protein product [Polarella glacialis]|uniref:EF-hand domain-containing protein n=1 Tax=Polarella glacialis TaxID=89957 RepID=A0A813DTN7_POLGL|nr:unnamed protein product [Polarella glacialis]
MIVSFDNMTRLAGTLLCSSCARLFGRCFPANSRKSDAEVIKHIFAAWDISGDGSISKDELKRVMKALNPDFTDRDLNALMRVADGNSSGLVEFNDFCDWIMAEEPLKIKDSFDNFVAGFMRQAGEAERHGKRGIAEVQVRQDGLMFVTRSGDEQLACRCCRSSGVELTILDGEEFIIQIECNEDGLVIRTNTGRVAYLSIDSPVFGPWLAPEGFHIIGLRTKPGIQIEDDDRVVGVRIAPLSAAAVYDAASSLCFAAEHGYLLTLREVLAKGALDVDQFGVHGVTPLMLAAQNGCTETMRLLMISKAQVNIADADGWTALTFAREAGNLAAADLLRLKGATQDGDGGNAIRAALRSKYNMAARAKLRKGFGPAERGAFALEQVPEEKVCKLKVPVVSPTGGSFTGPVVVQLTYGEVEASAHDGDASRQAEVTLLPGVANGMLATSTKASGALEKSESKTAGKEPKVAVPQAKAKVKSELSCPADVQILYTRACRQLVLHEL